MNRETKYCKRTWLNPSDSPSTGSIVCYAGDLEWRDGVDPSYFVEVADCHGKVRVHMSCQDTKEDYIAKVRSMRDALTDYLTYLEHEKIN